MNFSLRRANAALFVVVLSCLIALMGCSGNSDNSAAPASSTNSTAVTAVIGPAGGTLSGPDGVQVEIPPGALDQATTIGIARSSAGAPSALEAYPVAGNVYEFTPHDVIFNRLVTIRAPIPSGATGTSVFMASPGGDWKWLDAVVTNGVGEWQRNSFSFGYYGADCFVPTAMFNDPYWCVWGRSSAYITAAPAQAMTQTSVSNVQNGDAGSYSINQAATLQMTSNFGVPGNCTNVVVNLTRMKMDPVTLTWSPLPTIATQNPVLTVVGGSLKGTATFPFAASYSENGKTRFGIFVHYDCPKVAHAPNSSTVTGWDFSSYSSREVHDGMFLDINVPQPVVYYSVGGTVNGHTGTVALQNGTDSTSVAFGSSNFTFATSIGSGTQYAVTVQTPPAGQLCAVANGSGTAIANVTNVAVNCGYAIGGTVSGLVGTGLVLRNNGADDKSITMNGTFAFAAPVMAGGTYNVTVQTQPSGSNCTVQNGSGPVGSAAITGVAVICTSSGPIALAANYNSNTLSIFRADAGTGVLASLGTIATGTNPYAVAITPNGLYAYVTNQQGGTVSSYSIDNATGVVSLLNSTGSNNASGIAMDRLGRFIWVANWGYSTLSAFAIGANGVLAAVGSPLVTLSSYPYAITAHPTMDFVYVAHELSNAISVYSVNTNGSLMLQQTLSGAITSPSGIVIDPSGRFAYAVSTNGGISAFRIDAGNGRLASIGSVGTGGSTFSIAVHPNWPYVYVTNGSSSNNVLVFAINQSTGALTQQAGSPYSAGNNPRGVTVNAAGTYLYVTNYVSNDVSAFSISAGGATLTSLGAAVPTGNAPQGIAITP
jgi:6-phosphogluconolactonase (cycloisomerase 2 family)